MSTGNGLSKDGLSYRSDIYAMDLLIKIYVYGSILWVALIITIIVNNIRTRPIRPKKEKIYEKLHTYSKRQRAPPRMTYVDSKSFSSDRDKWEKEKSTEGSTRSERTRKTKTSSKEATTARTAATTKTGMSSGESFERTSREGPLLASGNDRDERSVEIGKTS
ncbi:unnamed protein product [Cylicocyclus nassatus]|uniref:Uncharacterized protein n=1 Tax=Cylicocyclus nassatus TaxID=53992 RepID=A0AA36GSH1_CYLNA|nr:unnamed protein product [Cylicocyclus nassatus]